MDDEIIIELYTPYKKQREIHDALNDKNIFGVTVVCGRQVGKTLLGINQSLMWALAKKNQTIMFVLPADSQASKVYKQTIEAVIDTKLIKSHKGQSGSSEIVFKNGSKILFRSALQEDTLRGYSNDYLIIDEAAFIIDTTIKSILLPTLSVKGKKVLILSTPKGKNWLYHYFNKPLDDNKWISFKFTSFDSPYINKDFLISQQQSLPDEIFNQEYMGEFVDKAGIFKNLDNILILNNPHPKGKVYCGVDLGMVNDYTVATIIDDESNVVDVLRFTQVTSTQLKQRLIEFFDKWQPRNIVVEQNGLGIPIVSDLLESSWSDFITPFVTTPKSKADIITNLVGLFNNNKIKLPNDNNLRLELENFIFINTPSGGIKYQGARGISDDMVMSLAFAVESMNRGNKKVFDYSFTML